MMRVTENGGSKLDGRPAPAPVRTINHQTSDRSQLAAGLRLLISVWTGLSPDWHQTRPDTEWKDKICKSLNTAGRIERLTTGCRAAQINVFCSILTLSYYCEGGVGETKKYKMKIRTNDLLYLQL